jgi:hypothetical protein
VFTPAKRPPSPTGYVDSRSSECKNGSPPCTYAPAPGDNPLGLCDTHLSEHRVRCGIPEPAQCPACNPVHVIVRGVMVFPVGAMCFACNKTTGGTVPSGENIHRARHLMTRRLAELFRSGDRGPEWVALLARCPADIRERIGVALDNRSANGNRQ